VSAFKPEAALDTRLEYSLSYWCARNAPPVREGSPPEIAKQVCVIATERVHSLSVLFYLGDQVQPRVG
jgi:hypothetical protein